MSRVSPTKIPSRRPEPKLGFDQACRCSRAFAGVAQLVEHLICNQEVAGSSPIASTMGGGSSAKTLNAYGCYT
jgi:hypothetical protein